MTVLEEFDSWLYATAGRLHPQSLGPNAEDIDDLAQIGRIAMWRASLAHDPTKGSLPYYLTMRAYGTMQNALRPRQKHNLCNPWVRAPEQLDDVDWDSIAFNAYHREEIADVVAALPPRQREYVNLRFHAGYTTSDMIEHFGYEPNGLWAEAKKKLQSQLAHLEAA